MKTGAGSERRFAITNCYAAGPRDIVERYRPFHALEVKGKACFADYGVAAADAGWPLLEEITFKRMVVVFLDHPGLAVGGIFL